MFIDERKVLFLIKESIIKVQDTYIKARLKEEQVGVAWSCH